MTARERSTAYPSLSLEEAVILAGKVRDALGSGDITRDQISPAIGHEKLTGPAASKIGAIAHYGLLDKGKGTYRISSLATKILSPISEQERVAALQEAALRPTLFAKIYETYLPDGRLPAAIEAIMHREHGVTRDASKTAHENLVDTLVYAGMLDEQTRCFGSSESCGDSDATEEPAKDDASRNPTPNPPAADAPSAYQVYELPMTFGIAKVILPPKLTSKDFATLESLVGLVKHFVSDAPAGEGSGDSQEG